MDNEEKELGTVNLIDGSNLADTETKEEKEKRKIKARNDDILRRLKAKEPLQEFASVTWFPPRPIIPKDPKLVKQVYGDDVKVIRTPTTITCIEGGKDERENGDE